MIAVLVLLCLALALTVGLRGAVDAGTIKIVNAKPASVSYGESDVDTGVGYQENFTGWSVGYQDQNVRAQVVVSSGILNLKGEFEPSGKFSSVAIFKQVNIDLASYPILTARLNSSSGVSYGLRFYSKYQNGTTANLWWEGSQLDHRAGSGPDTVRANIEYQSVLSTGRTFASLYYLEIYVEAAPQSNLNFTLSLARLEFLSDRIAPLTSAGDYRAVYVSMPSSTILDGSWSLEKIHFGVTVTASTGTVLEMLYVQGSRIYSSLVSSDYVYNGLNKYNEFTFYPSQLLKIFPELLPSMGSSLVLLARTGSIEGLSVESVDFIFLPSHGSSSDISAEVFAGYYTYLVSFLFLVPIPIALVVFWKFSSQTTIGRIPVVVVAVVGLACRFAIAPVASHRFDLDVFLTSARGWFQYGSPTGSIGPTLPFTFLLYWIPYSFYALLQVLGFHDLFLPTHQDGLIESIFIKMFPFAADVLVFYVLLQIKRGGKGLVYASFYLLNPLAIYISAVWGQYDAASVALIALGVFWLIRGKTGRAAIVFVFSGMVQLMGFIPYILTLIRAAVEKKWFSIPILLCALTLTLIYWPETLLLYLLFLSASGTTKSLNLSGPGLYSLSGNLPQLSFISSFHPMIISFGAIGAIAAYFAIRRRLTPDVILLLTGLVSVALLLFSDILAGWVWLLPVVLFYAALKEKDGLGVFSLVFGTSTAFLMMSFALGSRYVLTGDPNYPVIPAVELSSHGLQIFVLSVTALTGILMYLLWSRKTDAYKTLGLTAGFAIALNLTLLIGIGGLGI